MYILVPLYLETTTVESIKESVDKADFGEFWNVLQALQEQDEVLADIIRQMQEDKGRYGKYKDDGFGDKVDILGVGISLKTLQGSITAVCVEKLGFTWDLRYGELIRYKERFGDCNIPKRWLEDKQLGLWVGTQRANYNSGTLSEDHIKRLENIGFVWSTLESQWEEMFVALKEYKKDHGDCNVPDRWSENKQLATWVSTQRRSYKKGKLSDERIKRLEDISFLWKIHKK